MKWLRHEVCGNFNMTQPLGEWYELIWYQGKVED